MYNFYNFLNVVNLDTSRTEFRFIFNLFKLINSGKIMLRSVSNVEENYILLIDLNFYLYCVTILLKSTFVRWSSLRIDKVYFSCLRQFLMY